MIDDAYNIDTRIRCPKCEAMVDCHKRVCPQCGFIVPERKIKPPSLNQDFCVGCEKPMSNDCSGCIRIHINEEMDFNEGWKDNHSYYDK